MLSNSVTLTRGISSSAHCRSSSADGFSATDLAANTSVKPLLLSKCADGIRLPPVGWQGPVRVGDLRSRRRLAAQVNTSGLAQAGIGRPASAASRFSIAIWAIARRVDTLADPR